MAISDPPFGVAVADGGPDDLPRTLRRERDARMRQAREKEAREREARERDERERALGEAPVANVRYEASDFVSGELPPVAVSRLSMSFFHLMWFFLKAVFAAVPALIVLAAMIWMGMQALQIYFPDLVKMQILILFPPN